VADRGALREDHPTRRRVVMRAIGAVFGFIGAAVGAPSVGYFVGPAVRGMSPASWSPLGRAVPPTPRSSEPWVGASATRGTRIAWTAVDDMRAGGARRLAAAGVTVR